MDENQVALFFASLKQIVKALKYKYDEKEKDLSNQTLNKNFFFTIKIIYLMN